MGEISIKGPTVFSGYDNAPDMNLEARPREVERCLSRPCVTCLVDVSPRPSPRMVSFAVETWATGTKRSSCTSVVDPRRDEPTEPTEPNKAATL